MSKALRTHVAARLSLGVRVLAALALALVAHVASAAWPGLWLRSDGQVFELDSARGTVSRLALPEPVRLHAAQSASVHWVVTDRALLRVDLSTGTAVDMTPADIDADEIQSIVSDPGRGAVWIVTPDGLRIVADDGSVIAAGPLGEALSALTFDQDGTAWAATQSALVRLSPIGAIAERYPFDRVQDDVVGLMVDGYHDVAWLLSADTLIHVDLRQPVASTLAVVQRVSATALDASRGTLFAYTPGETITVGSSGEVLSREPNDQQGNALALLAPDAASTVPTAIFVDRAVRLDPSSMNVATFAFAVTGVARSEDVSKPVLRIVQPPDGVVLDHPLPSVVVEAQSVCAPDACPLPPGYWRHHEIRVQLDGVSIGEPLVVDAITGIANLADIGAVPPGLHVMTALLVGRDGSAVASDRVTFHVTRESLRNARKTNALPTVTLTAPTAGKVFTAPANIAMTATATDSDGTIAKVEFLKGTTVLGTDTVAPYAFTWTAVPAGTYSLAARATDNAGGVKTSATVSVIVNAPPTAKITSPLANAVFAPGSNISITATATDADGTIAKVEFYSGTTLLGTVTTTPYTFVWNAVPAGTYSLKAKSTDNRGAVTTSAAVSIFVNVPPTVTLTAPTEGRLYAARATIAMQATASDTDGTISKVEFYNGATRVGTDTTAPYAFSWANVGVGSYTLTAKAYDNRGTITTSAPVHVTVIAPPTVTLDTPQFGATFDAPANILLSATAATPTGTVTKVEFLNGAAVLATVTTLPYQYAWINVAAGSYNLTARVTTDRGLTASYGPVTVAVNAQVPLDLVVDGTQTVVSGNSGALGGTVQAPANTALLVNGVPGLVGDDGTFHVDNLPLSSGSNTVNLVLSTLDGRSITRTVTLAATGTAPPVMLVAMPSTGVAPMQTTLRPQYNLAAPVARLELDMFGVGGFTDWYGTQDRITVSYSVPGTYHPVLRVTDAQNGTYLATTTVVVRDPATLDGLFQAMWSNMNNALATGNLGAAGAYLTQDAHDKFDSVFTDLNGQFPGIVASYKQFYQVRIALNYAEYALVRTVSTGDRAFLVYFVLGEDGVWRIESM